MLLLTWQCVSDHCYAFSQSYTFRLYCMADDQNMKILLQSVLTRSPAQLGEMQLTYFVHIEDSLTKNFTFGFTIPLDLFPLIFTPVLFNLAYLTLFFSGHDYYLTFVQFAQIFRDKLHTILWDAFFFLHDPHADWTKKDWTENEWQRSQFPKKSCESPKENYWARVH